ncbi:diacylglycerol/lipid kinase family protein [Planctomonas deserti]|uniref:diacylglycerol/lipid kinase family protein n=1 Tax=Planctomonas deserti TaxID=2144185 RepID=UPI000D3C3790|nr:diacylglycerol kinase family protein [Planctomonas deserti]
MPAEAPARTIVVAINPDAASGRGAAVGARTVAALRRAGWIVTPLQEDSADALAAAVAVALAGGPRALIVVGGDGMVGLGANAVAGTDVPLGIVPCGTGNDMARNLGLPVGDVAAALSRLVAALAPSGGGSRRIDAGLVTHADGRETWFACALSAGFDAAVNERANRMRRPRGASRYVLALLRELVTFGPVDYRLTIDGREEREPAALVSVGNAGSIGGGMRITPDAVLDDGALDVLIVAPVSRLTFLRLFPRVFRGTHAALPQVRLLRARAIRIAATGARGGIVAYADGERLGPLPLDIRVVPGALAVLV